MIRRLTEQTVSGMTENGVVKSITAEKHMINPEFITYKVVITRRYKGHDGRVHFDTKEYYDRDSYDIVKKIASQQNGAVIEAIQLKF